MMTDIAPRSLNFGLSVTIAWAYRWRYSGQSVTKPSAYQWLPYRPIGALPSKKLSQNQALNQLFSTVTRARDLNLELTLLTSSPRTGSTGGSAPWAPQTHPTRLTPIWTALRANQNSTNPPRAASGGGK